MIDSCAVGVALILRLHLHHYKLGLQMTKSAMTVSGIFGFVFFYSGRNWRHVVHIFYSLAQMVQDELDAKV